MDDLQIQKLKETVAAYKGKRGKVVYIGPSNAVYHVAAVGKHPEEGEELCALLVGGSYCALYNAGLEDFSILLPVDYFEL